MRTKLWLLVVLASCGALCFASRAGNAEETSSEKAVLSEKRLTIQQLIAQLGDDQYLLRQRAEKELMERGIESFAELQAAENHADLEISTRAQYILNQIRIEWSRPTDAAVVRSIMARYGDLSQSSKLAKVNQLALLENEQGLGALCRIVRFDSSSPQVARRAALWILGKGFLPPDRAVAAVAMLSEEIGERRQVPLDWVRVYMDQLQSPKRVDPRWIELIDAEMKLLAEESNKTDDSLVLTFLFSHLKVCDKTSDAQAIFASWQRLLSLTAESDQMRTLGVAEALSWIIDRQQWEALGLFEDQYADAIKSQRLLVYLVAAARHQQGRPDEAEALADRAYRQQGSDDPDDPFVDSDEQQRNRCALVVSELGRHDWAEREWAYVIKKLPATHIDSLKARNYMALYRLNDRGEHKAAADLLSESIDAIDKDLALKRQFRSQNHWDEVVSATASREFYLASYYESQQDYVQQRRHLDQAYRLAPGNADVLIAMYRLRDASDAYRNATAKKLTKLGRSMEKDIKRSPRSAQNYNQWAWLISNTEGDFDKAVKYSQMSLKLSPGNPSYLDTLGRCYYAAGDLESAVKVQREAISKHPHLQVMQRQLALFETELLMQRSSSQ